jgi:hypothetical protein
MTKNVAKFYLLHAAMHLAAGNRRSSLVHVSPRDANLFVHLFSKPLRAIRMINHVQEESRHFGTAERA